jgi:hypothetical protein
LAKTNGSFFSKDVLILKDKMSHVTAFKVSLKPLGGCETWTLTKHIKIEVDELFSNNCLQHTEPSNQTTATLVTFCASRRTMRQEDEKDRLEDF